MNARELTFRYAGHSIPEQHNPVASSQSQQIGGRAKIYCIDRLWYVYTLDHSLRTRQPQQKNSRSLTSLEVVPSAA